MRRGSRDLERRREMPALGERASFSGDAGQARVRRRDRALAWVFCAGVHLIVFAALFWPHARPSPAKRTPSPILVSVLDNPAPPSPPKGSEAEPGGRDNAIQPTLLLPTAPSPVLPTINTADNSDLLSESQLAGTASVGEGGGNGGGGGCDLARAVQEALRSDSLVHTAVEDANRLGKAIMLWNGDWVRSGSQDGKGLSAVRQAIMWKVAFAPQACRNERMHRPVLLSLADGGTRFAIGSGDWRWSDLLGVHGVPPDR
jgi:hypothetical protein